MYNTCKEDLVILVSSGGFAYSYLVAREEYHHRPIVELLAGLAREIGHGGLGTPPRGWWVVLIDGVGREQSGQGRGVEKITRHMCTTMFISPKAMRVLLIARSTYDEK